MPTYNFKKDSKLYLVQNSKIYPIDLYPDLSFSQTFNETSVPVKTLHSQFNMFEEAVITRANPANFNFTIPILQSSDLDIVLKLLRDYSSSGATLDTADLYIVSNSETHKLEMAVIESGTFQIVMNAPLTLNVSGTARKLSKHTGLIPGTLQNRSTTRKFTRITALTVSVGNVVQPSITAVSMELKNNVQWVDYTTLQNSINVGASGTEMYPEAFVVSNRTLSGTIQQYVTNETNTTINKWSTNSPITITIKSDASTVLTFALPSAVYTNRLEVQDLFVQSYDFRLNAIPSNLADVINKN